ncbi:Uncharacterized protein Rs2_17331 [Raphanus sativus]|nr:Uncharacterized protein Rs2_17331 [Raphanus sativus]
MSKELLLFLIDNEKDLERLPVTDKTRWMFQFKVEQLKHRKVANRSQHKVGLNPNIYDSATPWILDVCRKHPGVAAASFFTQCSTVNAIYIHFLRGKFKEFQDDVVLPAMPPLKGSDLPGFLYDNNLCRPLFELTCSQFVNVDNVDFFLVNSFDELEPEVIILHLKTFLLFISYMQNEIQK